MFTIESRHPSLVLSAGSRRLRIGFVTDTIVRLTFTDGQAFQTMPSLIVEPPRSVVVSTRCGGRVESRWIARGDTPRTRSVVVVDAAPAGVGDVVAIDSTNSYLRSVGGKLLATVGVDNLVVVVTDGRGPVVGA